MDMRGASGFQGAPGLAGSDGGSVNERPVDVPGASGGKKKKDKAKGGEQGGAKPKKDKPNPYGDYTGGGGSHPMNEFGHLPGPPDNQAPVLYPTGFVSPWMGEGAEGVDDGWSDTGSNDGHPHNPYEGGPNPFDVLQSSFRWLGKYDDDGNPIGRRGRSSTNASGNSGATGGATGGDHGPAIYENQGFQDEGEQSSTSTQPPPPPPKPPKDGATGGKSKNPPPTPPKPPKDDSTGGKGNPPPVAPKPKYFRPSGNNGESNA